MASGCVPAHASYFMAYEVLKRYFQFKNEKYEVLSTAIIGALTTFTHDLFTTPCDSKPKRVMSASDQAAAAALL